MKWKVIAVDNRYLVCRKTWHSTAWMGIVKKDIRSIRILERLQTVEVYADCLTKELADRLLLLKS
jgi:hypothetical protein